MAPAAHSPTHVSPWAAAQGKPSFMGSQARRQYFAAGSVYSTHTPPLSHSQLSTHWSPMIVLPPRRHTWTLGSSSVGTHTSPSAQKAESPAQSWRHTEPVPPRSKQWAPPAQSEFA